jgi:hypothetical protein
MSLLIDEDVWKKLWKLSVVPKVRVFWWRVLRGILPDYMTLTRWHVMENNTCGICKADSETLMHTLTKCSHAKLFWCATKEVILLKLPRLHPSTWARDIVCDPAITMKERSQITSDWTSRNNITHGEVGFNPTRAMESIYETLQTLELPRV